MASKSKGGAKAASKSSTKAAAVPAPAKAAPAPAPAPVVKEAPAPVKAAPVKAAPVKVVLQPESFKRKHDRDEKLKVAAAEAAVSFAKEQEALEKEFFAKAQAYEEEYEKLAREAIDNRRQAKANNEIFVAPEEKVVFVIRIRGIIGISPKVKKILQLLRLRQLHNGVFVRVNAATINMLRLVEPFIAYGYPNLKSVRELIYKRGYAKLSGQRVPISANSVVAAGLGAVGLNCIEDVIHEIFTAGPNFKASANFLWPFKLTSPKNGFRGKKLNHFNEGGACGQQGDKINKLIKKML